MALTAIDRHLLNRCLNRDGGAWNDFVDRYLSLIYHVIHHTSYQRSIPVKPEDVEDVAAEILLQLVSNDYAVLRQFRGLASLATYLTVIARRICVHELAKRAAEREMQTQGNGRSKGEAEEPARHEVGLERLEEIQKLLNKLPAREREVVRLCYVEGRTYEEISTALHIPVNSIGPILSRAKKRLKKTVKAQPHRQPIRPQPE